MNQTNVASAGILERLRSATAARHQAIHAVVDVFHPGFGRSEYQSLLGSYLGFYEPVEAALGEVADAGFRDLFGPRRKGTALRADLSSLGLPRGAIDRLSRCGELPRCTRLSEALGVMYVLEGATLGGVFIARKIERLFAGPTPAGVSFFKIYGEDVATMWDRFRSFLVERTPEGEEDVVIASACLTFDRFHDWLRSRT